jgi:lipoprotein-anchoring transpeptidase ErfK/SrfK
VLAFRKVNGMSWTRRASPEVLARLVRERGAFRLRFPRAGRHVEVDVKRQVMVLADRGKPSYTFPISSGHPSTPSDLGHFHFYRRVPGYNNSGMLDSVYYNRGEAVHGYRSVPTYPASHGCIRAPIADARFIYDWVRLGISIYVY